MDISKLQLVAVPDNYPDLSPCVECVFYEEGKSCRSKRLETSDPMGCLDSYELVWKEVP